MSSEKVTVEINEAILNKLSWIHLESEDNNKLISFVLEEYIKEKEKSQGKVFPADLKASSLMSEY